MSGVTRHPRLLSDRTTPKSSRLADVVTVLTALGMCVGLVLLLAAYFGILP